MAAAAATLYLSYDGMMEPLGQSQVLAYLIPLARERAVHLVSFEKRRDMDDVATFGAMARRMKEAGISWHPRAYHKRPPILSTLWDMMGAVIASIRIARRHDIRIFHGRSILSAAMLWPARRLAAGRLLVDIRGFWADERVDGVMIPSDGIVYRVLKVIETRMLRAADHIVTLTHASVPVLRNDERMGRPRAPITVIPTCADLALFKPPAHPTPAGTLTVGYVGQLGTWYMLDEMIAFFLAIQRRRPDARLLIVNQHQQDMAREALERAGVEPAAVELLGASRSEVPGLIGRMSIAMALITPRFSKIASAPTKFGEYLGCGVPVFANAGCGDMADLIRKEQVGIAIEDATPDAIDRAAEQFLELLPDEGLEKRCVDTAHRHFTLEDGVAAYARIYADLSQ